MHKGRIWSFKFPILLDGHVTQIPANNGPSFLLPGSSNLIHGLILFSEQNPSKDLILDNISFLAFPPSKWKLVELTSLQDKQNLKLMMKCPFPKLKYIY